MTRAYDDPNHEFYGPVRRCWVILAGMFDMGSFDTMFDQEWGRSWDTGMVVYLKAGASEAEAIRDTVWCALEAEMAA